MPAQRGLVNLAVGAGNQGTNNFPRIPAKVPQAPKADLSAIDKRIDALKADLDAAKESLTKIVDLLEKLPVAKEGKPGPAGPKGDPGIAGLAGPVGPAGKDTDPARLANIDAAIRLLQNQTFTAELHDANGVVIQTVPFSATVPLRIKLVPVSPK